MNRDYKRSNTSGNGKSTNSLLLGIVIGLVLGLAIALGVAWYISRGPSPFVGPDKPAAADAKPDTGTVQGLPPAAPANGDRQAKADAKPRFDFYKILPGKEEAVTPQDLRQELKRSPQQAAASVYYLQAGAFQNAADADNLKAKLALLGLQASIQTAALPERGTWHRVRLGPYKNADDVSRVQGTLKQNGIESALIRVTEGAKP